MENNDKFIDESFSKKTRKIILVVGSYWFVSILMVFLNKYLLSSPNLKFDAPLFVTWYQCFFCFIIYSIIFKIKEKFPNSLSFIPHYSIDNAVSFKILPLALIFVSMIMFNNLSLKYVAVSFYMIVRSLSTVFNVILVYIYFGEKTSLKAIICCALITFGFFMGIQQENDQMRNLTLKGVFFGLLSSIFAALNGVYIKKTIQLVDNNLWKLNYLLNFYASLMLIPLIIFFDEYKNISNFENLFTFIFWSAISLSGVLGFLVGYVTSLQIKMTSPLTHNISGTTKSYVQTVLGVLAYNEQKSFLWWISNFFVLIGAALYSHVRTQEMRENHNRRNQTNEENEIKKTNSTI